MSNNVKLCLKFVGADKPVLDTIDFMHPLIGESRTLHRGTASKSFGQFCFTWSAAVKGFSLLVIKTLAGDILVDQELSSSQDLAVLSGSTGSPASSLDYALSKRPNWLLDLFGVDSQGVSHVSRFFDRRNPERRSPGPVYVSLKRTMLPKGALEVWLDQQQLLTLDSLNYLATAIELQFKNKIKKQAKRTNVKIESAGHGFSEEKQSKLIEPASHLDPEFAKLMKRLFLKELSWGMNSTPVFGKSVLFDSIQLLRQNELIRSVGTTSLDQLEYIVECTSPRVRMGLPANACHQSSPLLDLKHPLKVKVSAITVGALSLFKYLQFVRQLPLSIDNYYSGGSEIAVELTKGTEKLEPDLVVAAAPSVMEIINSAKGGPYKPIMFMPKHSHRVLAPSSSHNESLKYGDYYFFNEAPSGSRFYFEELKKRKFIREKDCSVCHCATEDTLLFLKNASDDLRCIVWFPLYNLAHLLYNVKAIDSPTWEYGSTWIVLLAHERICIDERITFALLSELYNAWIDFRTSSKILESVVDYLLGDQEYLKILFRACGLHRLIGSHMLPVDENKSVAEAFQVDKLYP